MNFGRMKRGAYAPLFCLAAATVSVPVLAQPRSGGVEATSPATKDQVKAQQHFQHAKELYLAGSYRDAITELEIARKLDPKAKDLVMNLGIVNEKLGKFDEAVSYFKSYLEMDGVTPQERAKAEGIIKRIEGAKREIPIQPATTPPASAPSAMRQEPGAGEPPRRGRIDALTIAGASLAAIGLVGGTSLGIYALSSRPSDFVTGRDGSYATLQHKTDDAHTVAVLADVSLGVGIVAAVITGWLYFGRTKEPSATPAPRSARVSVAPMSSGGVFLVDGSF